MSAALRYVGRLGALLGHWGRSVYTHTHTHTPGHTQTTEACVPCLCLTVNHVTHTWLALSAPGCGLGASACRPLKPSTRPAPSPALCPLCAGAPIEDAQAPPPSPLPLYEGAGAIVPAPVGTAAAEDVPLPGWPARLGAVPDVPAAALAPLPRAVPRVWPPAWPDLLLVDV